MDILTQIENYRPCNEQEERDRAVLLGLPLWYAAEPEKSAL